jgi:hypothetical protein
MKVTDMPCIVSLYWNFIEEDFEQVLRPFALSLM